MADRSQPRCRASREVEAEHRTLDALFSEVGGAAEGGDLRTVTSGLDEIEEALRAHFDREDRLYYPSIRALRPQYGSALRALIDAHDGLLVMVRGVHALLDSQPDRAHEALAEFVKAFTAHEAKEEALLAAVDREIEAATLS